MVLIVSNPDTTTADHALALLNRLGTTSSAVAAALELAGCHGEQCDRGTCPVAIYLLRCIPGLVEVLVDVKRIRLYFTDGSFACVDTPEPIKQFVISFDTGLHLQLVKVAGR